MPLPGAQLLQGDAGVDAQIFLEMTPGLAAQAFQRLDFVREKPLLHRQFDVEDFQALLRDHPVTEFGRVSPQGLPDQGPHLVRVDLDASHGEDGIRAPGDFPQARQGAAAGTRFL